jgi:outer membrane protein TolC
MNILLCLPLLCAPLIAQEPLTLKDAVRLALSKNPSVAASAAGEREAALRVAQSRGGFQPKLNYSESWARSDNPVFVFSSLLTQHQFTSQNFQLDSLNRPDFLNNFSSRLTADQSLYDAGRTNRAVASTKLEQDVASEDGRQLRMQIVASVVRSYFDALLSAEALDVSTQAIRSAEADLARAEANRAAGMSTDVDVLSIRVHLADVREGQIRRSADLDVARAALNDALGLPLDAPHVLTTPLAPATSTGAALDGWEARGLEYRPEAREGKLAIRLAQNRVADARASFLPQVDVHAAFEADRQRFYDRGGTNWLASVELRWNLFNGSADKAHLAETRAALERFQSEEKQADSAIRLQVRRSWADLQAALQRIEVAQATVAEAEESLRITKNRYEAGLVTVTDLLRNETALLEAQTRHLAAVRDQRIAAAVLELSAGSLTLDSQVLN